MANLPPTIMESLMKQIGVMPLWVRQVVYAQLKLELEQILSSATLEAFSQEHMLQLWIPELSREGVQVIASPTVDRASPLIRLLHLTRFKKDVANITVLNNWSLEQCSLYLREAIDKGYLIRPQSGVVLATIDYLAGVTRLGEYLVKINRVTEEQLDQALRTQKYIEESMGERTGIANVLINLGYIRKEDTEGILFLKEESGKQFQMPAGLVPNPAPAQPGQTPQQQSPKIQSPSQQQQPAGPRPTPPLPNWAAPAQQSDRITAAGSGEPRRPAPPPSQEPEKKDKKWGLF